MENATTEVKTEAPKNLPPNIPLRELTRNGTTLTPTWAEIARGQGKGLFYPVVLPTNENWDTYVKYKGLDNIIDELAASERQAAQFILNIVVSKADKWVEIIKTVKDKDTNEVKQVLDKEGKPEVEKITIAEADYRSVMDDLLAALEKGSIRGGVTIASLVEENKALMAEIVTLMPKAKKGDLEALAKASEISEKFAKNEETIAEIKASRSKSKLSAADNSGE